MNKETFVKKLADILLAENSLTENTTLDSLPGWDSMGQLSIVALFDECLGRKLPPGSIQNCETINDILVLAGF